MHKLTTSLARRFDPIVIEDLNVSGMAKNGSLAGAVLACGLNEIRRQFRYKAAIRGGRIMIADRFYPSTQICHRPERARGNACRRICSECGAEHERVRTPQSICEGQVWLRPNERTGAWC
jgi:putative transposase